MSRILTIVLSRLVAWVRCGPEFRSFTNGFSGRKGNDSLSALGQPCSSGRVEESLSKRPLKNSNQTFLVHPIFFAGWVSFS